jgi:hypothetical protein
MVYVGFVIIFYGYFVITEEVSNPAELIEWVGHVAYI